MRKCVKENIVNYIKYVRCELGRTEERRLDHHIQKCEDCLISFAYIEEIVTNKQKLEDDEKTLLLRYLSDPIWLYEREKLKQEILVLTTNIDKVSTIKTDIFDSSHTDKIVITNTDNSNTVKGKKNTKLTSRYSLLIAAALILVFLSLPLGIYLSINKKQSSSLIEPSASTIPQYYYSKYLQQHYK